MAACDNFVKDNFTHKKVITFIFGIFLIFQFIFIFGVLNFFFDYLNLLKLGIFKLEITELELMTLIHVLVLVSHPTEDQSFSC